MTPVEIMATAMVQWMLDDIHPDADTSQSLAHASIAALEAAGWRIVHPEKVTIVVADAMAQCDEKKRDEETGAGATWLELAKAAIAAAPLHGKG